MSYAVLETVRDDLGVIVRHVWHERMSGRSSYHVCPWIDATTYHEGSTR